MRACLSLVAAVVLAGPTAAQPKADPRLEKVFADWKARQAAVKTARYTITGTIEYKDKTVGPNADPLPAGNPVRPKNATLLIDVERGRLRLEATEDMINLSRGFLARRSTKAYDGKAYQEYTHRRENGIPDEGVADLVLTKGNLGLASVSTEWWPILFTHGIIPTHTTPPRPDRLPKRFSPELFDFHGEQTQNSRPCRVVRTEPAPGTPPITEEFWADADRTGAVVRYVTWVGTNPTTRLDTEWTQALSGWRPERWTHTWTVNGQVKRVQKLRVERFEADLSVSDGDFELPAEPGMKVRVTTVPEAGTGLDPRRPMNEEFHVGPSGSWEQTRAEGFTTAEGRPLPPPGQGWWWWAVGAALIVGVGGFILYQIRRHSRRTLRSAI